MRAERQFVLALLFSLSVFLWLPDSAQAFGGCDPSPTTLCLQSNQFGVGVEWDSPSAMGSGEVIGPNTLDTGFFRFDDTEAAELLVRVVDACALNNHYWVFLAGVSSYAQTVQITDFGSGGVRSFINPMGALFLPIVDTTAFACVERAEPAMPELRGGNDLFLDNGRFRISVDWSDGIGGSGSGNGISVTDRSGAFWLVSSSDLQILVKMVPDAGSGFYSFTYGSLSGFNLDITVRDLCEGQMKTYNQPLGTPAAATDSMAFPVDCTAQIFSDGFESGDVTGWDLAVP